MDATTIIHSCDFDGVRLNLTPEGKLHYSGDPDSIAEWLPILREHKSELLAELKREQRRTTLMAMLSDGRKYAVLVDDDSTDPVIATVGIRGIATFEMAIPKHSYDGMVLLELLEKHSTETALEPSQLSGEATPSPNRNGSRQAHPDRRTA